MPPITCGEYSGFVFGTKTGAPYIANDVEDKFRNALKHYNAYETEQAKLENREPALIENCCPHSLRHSFCSLLCENDVNIKTIQEIMGHKNVATTVNTPNRHTFVTAVDLRKKRYSRYGAVYHICLLPHHTIFLFNTHKGFGCPLTAR